MTTGTKVFLAAFAAIVGVLVLYYGMVAPSGQPQPAISDSMIANDPAPPAPGGEQSNVVSTSFELVDPATTSQGPAQPTETAADPLARFPGTPPSVANADGLSDGLVVPLSDSDRSLDQPIQPPPAASAESLVEDRPAHAAADPLMEESREPATPAKPDFKFDHIIRPQPKAAETTPAARTKPPAQNPAGPKTVEYIVKHGDTMVSIAADWFGDESKWSLIAKANPWVDPARMQIGQKLQLPPKDAQPEPIRPTSESGPAADKKSDRSVYIVRSGDTLAKIAREVYGNVAKWKDIYDANRAIIGNDPADLSPGMKLTLPKAPSAAKSR